MAAIHQAKTTMLSALHMLSFARVKWILKNHAHNPRSSKTVDDLTQLSKGVTLLITGKFLKGSTNMDKSEALQDDTLRFLTVLPKSPRIPNIQSCQSLLRRLLFKNTYHLISKQKINKPPLCFGKVETRHTCGVRLDFSVSNSIVACERFASGYHARILAQKKWSVFFRVEQSR